VQRPAVVTIAIAFMACGRDQQRPLRPPPGPPSSTVEIHQPERLTSIATGERDALGRAVRVACVTCHSLRTPAALPTTTAELDEFHQGLQFAHGTLSCGSCHVAGDQRALRRADGTSVDLRDAIVVCRQCHGPQTRDYDRGSHGGMNGHWDLSVGGRVRNHCVDCHDPHTPKFQPTLPVLLPHDRGTTGRPASGGH
jgi:formate-dependent nitrite reductase cytochrome c552 subunit